MRSGFAGQPSSGCRADSANTWPGSFTLIANAKVDCCALPKMKNIITGLVSIGAIALFAAMFLLALIETILRGNKIKILDRGLDEEAP